LKINSKEDGSNGVQAKSKRFGSHFSAKEVSQFSIFFCSKPVDG
jgi:hypothetical protein